MSARRFPPDDPREWLNRARSSLAKAAAADIPEVYREDLCFDAQQAAEKALKAVLLCGETHFAIPMTSPTCCPLSSRPGLSCRQR
jgi:hypothetical protein